MEKIIPAEKFAKFSELWTPKIVAGLNDSYIKFVKIKGEFVWHKHDNEDEMFFVYKGLLTLEFRDGSQTLEPGDFLVVPRGVEHRPVCAGEAHLMVIEPKTTLNTGDAVDSDYTVAEPEWI